MQEITLAGMELVASLQPHFTTWQEDHLTKYFSACSAVIQREDDDGVIGVKIGKELMNVAGMALKANITQLGPLVLPISEQLIFAGNFVARKVRQPPYLLSTSVHVHC